MSYEFEVKIRRMIESAMLTDEEIRRLDAEFAGISVSEHLVKHIEFRIEQILDARKTQNWIKYDFGTGSMVDAGMIKKVMGEPMKHEFKIVPNNAYHLASDDIPQCPNCSTQGNSRVLGMVNIINNGSERSQPAYVCISCNQIYSDVPNSIKCLNETLRLNGQGEVLSFIPANTESTSPPPNADNSYGINQISQNTQQLNSTMQSMLFEIQNLTQQVREIAEKNNQLLDKLSKDPLSGIRKSILDFNLQ